MNTDRAQIKTRTQNRAGINVAAGEEYSRGALVAVGVIPTLAGLWSGACLISAMVASGGPLALIKSWFMAVGGF